MKLIVALIIFAFGCQTNATKTSMKPVVADSADLFVAVDAWLAQNQHETWTVERVMKKENKFEVLVVAKLEDPKSDAKLLELDPKTFKIVSTNKAPADYGWSAF